VAPLRAVGEPIRVARAAKTFGGERRTRALDEVAGERRRYCGRNRNASVYSSVRGV
jgi:hypothetical protein